MFIFTKIIEQMRTGAKVKRMAWSGSGVFIFLVTRYRLETPSLVFVDPQGTSHLAPFIAMRNADGTIEPWIPQKEDLMAEDFVVCD